MTPWVRRGRDHDTAMTSEQNDVLPATERKMGRDKVYHTKPNALPGPGELMIVEGTSLITQVLGKR